MNRTPSISALRCLQNPSRLPRPVCSSHQPNGQKTHCNSTVRQSYRSDDLVEKSWTKAKFARGKKRAAGILKFQVFHVFPSGVGGFEHSGSTYSFDGFVFQLTPENVLTMLTVSTRHHRRDSIVNIVNGYRGVEIDYAQQCGEIAYGFRFPIAGSFRMWFVSTSRARAASSRSGSAVNLLPSRVQSRRVNVSPGSHSVRSRWSR
jgi:hypothetical protein